MGNNCISGHNVERKEKECNGENTEYSIYFSALIFEHPNKEE